MPSEERITASYLEMLKEDTGGFISSRLTIFTFTGGIKKDYMNIEYGFLGEHLKIMKLSFPFTMQELKSSFRALAFEHHPDKGGSEKEFVKIKKSYDTLLPHAIQGNNDRQNEGIIIRTIDGCLLSELGKGLPENVNSDICRNCGGNGYVRRLHTDITFDRKCQRCQGQGFINNKWKRGMSFLNFWGSFECPVCNGTGGINRRTICKTLYHTCDICKGTGEFEVINPVLRKCIIQRMKQTNKPKTKKYCNCGALLKNGECWRCSREIKVE